ncbi:malate synthase G [Colwellia sp. M166]|uniref:malate synthase G n=1 Tax=Colwellia sp. M166 TaxID=2583805 RepID=UPI00211EBD69|nr:malate synthase G [Colwellia sp. M166]UUO23182.1 malate synthase G [Colwellia sp. M166]|tara:strand:+ start:57747 stop:59921 length:2175 start_codon:yes stop_codon:yes gene_type:complete
MTKRISIANLQVAETLYNFVNKQVLPGTSLAVEAFWAGFAKLITDLSPKNKALLLKRTVLQQKITAYHQAHQAESFEFSDYKRFLTDIGYLAAPVADFAISTENVDAELATMAGPQLVVPVMNARFALNAVNARWGSLYDALYGSDVISETDGAEKTTAYNPARGAKVVAFSRDFLDQAIPLIVGSHQNAQSYQILDNALVIKLDNGDSTGLAESASFIGFNGEAAKPSELVFKHNDLHFIVQFDASNPIAQSDMAGISDIAMESALTTIMDCEDSVAAVDAEDKIIAYQNWLGLNQGTLSETFEKSGKQQTRLMHQDKNYQKLDGTAGKLKGRSLMFVRNVGHLMTNNAILDQHNNEVPEGIMDAVITSLISTYDVNQHNTLRNSDTGSVYIVKPKMHGPEEVAFANELFDRVEELLSLPRNTLKMGIMDEERRTSVNLKACIYAAKERVVFINTGFLDRTGDEIHTSMSAGVMARKADIKLTKWISAYEDNNVDIGLACGFSGKAQIGKGMWPIPDQMANMLATKINHVEAGANTAWVPSPTAATLHALHYHKVNVLQLQQQLKNRIPANVDDILTIPLAEHTQWSEQEISDELDNNSQGILGYVVRWIDQGVGCSKVPDINDVGLMEDRATLRISSQHMANWLQHNICTAEQVLASMKKMASIVDQQNQNDAQYHAMSDNFDNNIAFQTALALVFQGHQQPNGYTEPLLHKNRLLFKAQAK